MRQWFAESRQIFRSLRKIRRDLLQETWGLPALPPHRCLRDGHLDFVSTSIRSTPKCPPASPQGDAVPLVLTQGGFPSNIANCSPTQLQ